MSKKKGKRYRYQTNTQDLDWQEAVSYTHLTLPTILRV